MIDIVCAETPTRGSRVHAGVSVGAGGSAVNAAKCAAAAGAEACVVGRIGNDPAGDLVRATLAGSGIEAHLARDPDLRTGVVAFAVASYKVDSYNGNKSTAEHLAKNVRQKMERDDKRIK